MSNYQNPATGRAPSGEPDIHVGTPSIVPKRQIAPVTASDVSVNTTEGSAVPVVYGIARVKPMLCSIDDVRDYGTSNALHIGVEAKVGLVLGMGKCTILRIIQEGLSAREWESDLVVKFPALANYVNDGSDPATHVLDDGLSVPGVVKIWVQDSTLGGTLFLSMFHHMYYNVWNYINRNYSLQVGGTLPELSFLLKRDLSHTGISHYDITWAAGDGYTQPPYDYYGANPAAVIYDLLTNAQYGLGLSASDMDISSFNATADALFALKYGINLLIDQTADARSVIQEICDQTGAMLYLDSSGKFAMRYCDISDAENPVDTIEEEDLKSFTIAFKRLSDTVNDLSATYTEIEQDSTVCLARVLNTGNVEITGSRREATYSLSFFNNKLIASRRLYDILKYVSYPLSTMQATVSHKFFDLLPGDVVRVKINRRDIDQPYRIVRITENADSLDINLELSEVPYFTEASTFYQGANPEAEPINIGAGEDAEVLTFPAFSGTSTAFSAPFVDPAKVHVKWGAGQEQDGELANGTDFTCGADTIILDPVTFANDIQANALGLLFVYVWEVP
jgi:hypothetical protein